MLNLHSLWTLAVAEMRSCRRLVRTWVFVTVAVGVCTYWYVQSLDAPSNPIAPIGWVHNQMLARYTITSMMNAFVAIFSIGIIFLAFDIHARDVKCRIYDVVESLPATNIEIIFGRLTGIILLVLVPCALFLVGVLCYEFAAQLLESPFRMGVQPVSMAAHMVWNVVPNLVFFGTLVVFLSTLVRSRLVVVLLALGLLIGSLWATNHIPILFQKSIWLYVGNSMFPSELAPTFATPIIVGSRLAILVVSIALLLFAASLRPRLEPQRTLSTAAGVTASVLGSLMIFGLFSTVQGKEDRKDEWVKTHQQQNSSAFPDVQLMSGDIVLQPGRKITLDVTLTVLPPTANTTDSVVFSLNPGYTIQKLFVDGTEISDFDFDAGLLIVSSELLLEESHEIRVKAKGKLVDHFAYLDQARDFQKLPHSTVPRLGLRNSIFDANFVALMPATIWYPISGVATDNNRPEQKTRDLFSTDLTIHVPKEWQVVTVGKREVIEQDSRTAFKFTSGAVVPEIALLAAKFDQRAMSIEGIEFEVLFSKRHRQNFDVLAPINDQIRQFVAERINNARALSLDYPYGAFYVVEVPSTLRSYRGGWQMDSALHVPGMMLVRETSFPTAPFETLVESIYEQETDSPDEQHERLFNELLEYFGNDMQGSSPFTGFARNFISHQVAATDRGATAIQYILDQLANQLITQHESYSIISLSEYGTGIASLWATQTPDFYAGNRSTQRRMNIATLPSTWEFMNESALVDLEYYGHPVLSSRVLLTKGHALAKTMITHYGTEKIGEFLAQTLHEYQEQSFTLEQLVSVAASIDIDLLDWVTPWLEDTVLPGYLADSPTISKLKASEPDETSLQTTITVHNAEAIPGYVRIVWSESHAPMYQWSLGRFTDSDPVFVGGNSSKRFAIQSAKPLTGVWIHPYLAHNRAPVSVLLPEFEEDKLQESPALPFMSDGTWQATDEDVVLVDDLDEGFSIVEFSSDTPAFSLTQQFLRSSNREVVYDQGLITGRVREPGDWLRFSDPTGYGHYRRTFARIARGEGSSAARYEARLPRDGHWKLEYFVPGAAFVPIDWGTGPTFFGFGDKDRFFNRRANPNEPEQHYRLEIKDGQKEWKEEFDIANANEGWNDVGTFELSSTDVEVLLSDWAGHREIMVYADAIRWTPVIPINTDQEEEETQQ